LVLLHSIEGDNTMTQSSNTAIYNAAHGLRHAESSVYIDRGLGPIMKFVYLGIGWFFVALGTIGIFLPVLPTTPFLLISLWAFSRSSPRMHNWLYTHPKAGPYLVAWSEYHVIPPKAKMLSVTLMTASWLYVTFKHANSWVLPAILAAVMGSVFFYILSKPSYPPAETVEADEGS
jgi:uncharacterized protein